MEQIKFHHHKNLKAYYTKRGRIWHVEARTQTHKFKSIEAMVESFPGLLEVEAIKNSVERRAVSRPPVQIQPQSNEGEDALLKTTECYYCSRAGEDALLKTTECYYCSRAGEVISGLPCSNCGGKGVVIVTTKGL